MDRRIRRAIGRALAPALVALAGCKTEPPPAPEEIRRDALVELELPDTWDSGAAEGAVQDDWLANFADPELSALVAEALAKNPDLRAAAARVEQAAGYLEASRSALKPALSVFGTGGLEYGGGGDLGSALQGLLLGASWELDLWGRLRYGRNAAEETLLAFAADYEFARQSLAATLARGWFTATETHLQGEIADELIQASGDLVDLAQKRFDVGAGTEQDVVLARATVDEFEDTARQVRQAHDQAVRAIELLLGRYPAVELATRTSLPPLVQPVPAGMPLEMLERRPDLLAAERRVAAAFHRVGEARTAMLPSVTLNASVSALSSEVLELKDDFENPTGGFGVTLLAPLYRGGAMEAQVEIRSAEQREALAGYAVAALRAIGEVENALSAANTLEDRESILRLVVAENERAQELLQRSYEIGQTDLRSVRLQLLDLHAARVALLRVQSERLVQRVNLHLALGGSFERRPEPASEPAEEPTR